MITFRITPGSGLPPYLQIVQQTREAVRLGYLRPGDQLPTVKDVVAVTAINPNTVAKAYRELERDGLVSARPGVGTFVAATLGEVPPATYASLRRSLETWLRRARGAGLDDDGLTALFNTVVREQRDEGVA